MSDLTPAQQEWVNKLKAAGNDGMKIPAGIAGALAKKGVAEPTGAGSGQRSYAIYRAA